MPQKKKPYLFLVMGPQGSGKGTQAELLAQKFKLKYFGSGDQLRQLARQKTPLGRKVKKTIDGGNMVSWQLITRIIREELKKPANRQKGYAFDGFCRRLVETKAILKTIQSLDRHLSAVFLINISQKETVKRLSKRLICTNGHIFTIGVSIKRGAKKCPKCGAKVYQREDDKPKAIKRRLRAYHKETMPSVSYFKELGLLVNINGEQPIKKVFQDILKAIKKLKW